jgi:hypothetical protein
MNHVYLRLDRFIDSLEKPLAMAYSPHSSSSNNATLASLSLPNGSKRFNNIDNVNGKHNKLPICR